MIAAEQLSLTGQAALKIVVIEGEGSVNIIQQKTATAPVVEVRDQNDLPIAGVSVTFSIGGSGASFGGSSTLTVVTNAAGRAAATSLTPTASGSLQIGVSAAFQGQTAATTIAQMNVLTAAQAAGAGAAVGGATAGGAASGAGGLSLTTIGIIGGVAVGGAVATAQALSGNADAPAPLVTESFAGSTEVFPGIAFRISLSTPPFTIRTAESVPLAVRFTAPADCVVGFSICSGGLETCNRRNLTGGAAGSLSWNENLQPGSYSLAAFLETNPRSANGPLCQAFTGLISFTGTATHR